MFFMQIGIFFFEDLFQKNVKIFFQLMEKMLKGECLRGFKKVCCFMFGNVYCMLLGKFIVFLVEFKMMWW